MTQELLGRVYRELLDVLKSINQDEIHHDGDDFHELLSDVKEALAQTQEPVVKLKTSNMLLRCHRCGCSDKLNIQIEYTAPPQRTERPVDCERCNRLEEQAYDLVGKLRVANIKLSMQPQRKPLTDEELFKIWLTVPAETEGRFTFARAIEAAHGIKE